MARRCLRLARSFAVPSVVPAGAFRPCVLAGIAATRAVKRPLVLVKPPSKWEASFPLSQTGTLFDPRA
jgi:hypothetical protein